MAPGLCCSLLRSGLSDRFLLFPNFLPVYMAEERTLREAYKTAMTEWRKKCAEEKRVEREERERAAIQHAEALQPHQGAEADSGNAPHSGAIDNKWMSMQQQQQQQQEDMQQQQLQQQQQQQPGMFSNPYLHGAGQGMDARAAALGLNPGANPYLANAFAGQGYMQGMQAAGNPALASLFGKLIQVSCL